MKNLIFLFLIMVAGNGVFAGNNNVTEINDSQKKSVSFEIRQPGIQSTISFDGGSILRFGIYQQECKKITVQILEDGVSLMSVKYSGNFITDGFDLAQLPPGSYTIRIIQGDNVFEKSFNKTTEAAIFE